VRGRRDRERHAARAAPRLTPERSDPPSTAPVHPDGGCGCPQGRAPAVVTRSGCRQHAQELPRTLAVCAGGKGVVGPAAGSWTGAPSTFSHRCVHSWGRTSTDVVTPLPFLHHLSHRG
jgi:hypothetical protein